jgi:hypothetical protein
MIMVDRTELLKEAKSKYNSYDTDDWIKAGFDEFSGGSVVYHKKHRFDPTIGKFGIPRGDYEKNSAKVLSSYGMEVVLGSEISGWKIKIPDGLLNGISFDIKGIEGKGNRIIKAKISDASKQGAEAIVLYFHDKTLDLHKAEIDVKENGIKSLHVIEEFFEKQQVLRKAQIQVTNATFL